MTIDTGEYKSKIGLDKLYIAEVLEDSADAYTADDPMYLAPAAEASQEPTVNTVTQYADDLPFDVISAEGETQITLAVTNLPLSVQAKITGKIFDEENGLEYGSSDVPPYFALMFRSLKSNGSYRYYSFLKGRFDLPKEETATRTDTPDPKNLELVYTAIFTTHQFDLADGVTDSIKRIVGDEDIEGFDPDGWFDAVPVPLYDGSA
jgi:phi13 family phage major tail protein